MIDKFLSRSRIRAAGRKLSRDPSAGNYVALAQAKAGVGRLEEVRRLCEEGLQRFPGNAELRRILERTGELHLESRRRRLQRELKESPRPAVYRELCEMYLGSSQVARAEEAATEWWEAGSEPEAMLFRAQARCERFFSDRRRVDGREAVKLIEEAARLLPGDARPLHLRLTLASRCGAWGEARTTLARLLEMFPGDPSLEARFRSVLSLSDNAMGLEQAFREVELSGRLVDDDPTQGKPQQPAARSVRPLLQELATDPNVRGAFYVRGGTALVQGLKGATAERTARTVRELVNGSRDAARRLGLGRAIDVTLEGSFGVLHLFPGQAGVSALWTKEMPSRRQLLQLGELSGVAETNLEVGT